MALRAADGDRVPAAGSDEVLVDALVEPTRTFQVAPRGRPSSSNSTTYVGAAPGDGPSTGWARTPCGPRAARSRESPRVTNDPPRNPGVPPPADDRIDRFATAPGTRSRSFNPVPTNGAKVGRGRAARSSRRR